MEHTIRSRKTLFRRALLAAVLLALVIPAVASAADGPTTNWYKGNIHCHSFWSDGNDFPDMVADWYKAHGFQFLGLSDHNVLARGEQWKDIEHPKHPLPIPVLREYVDRFGKDWVEIRGRGRAPQVRLRTLDEIRGKLEEPGKFLMIETEEITGSFGDTQVHLNAVNIAETIPPQEGQSVVDTLRRDVAAVRQQAERLKRKIPVQVNHPNWRHFDITAEDIAAVDELRLLEFCNNSPGTNNAGDAHHPSAERLWDIANTIRVGRMHKPPLFGTATDDAHKYHVFRPGQGNPGRGWIMVRAAELSVDAIVDAIVLGEFYCSTGVTLREVAYDPETGTLTVEVEPEPRVQYRIEIVGTLADYDPTVTTVRAPAFGRWPAHEVNRYSEDVGRVLADTQGTKLTYKLTGKELYVRAVVRSNKTMANPPEPEGMTESAWTQPVGWEKWMEQ